LIIREAIPHRFFARKLLFASINDVVAALRLSCSVVFRSLMISVDQSIVPERCKTFSEFIDSVLLCGSEHFENPYLSGISSEGDNVVNRLDFEVQSESRPY
jgi:hypothetical protein